jgi:hypothetical protein
MVLRLPKALATSMPGGGKRRLAEAGLSRHDAKHIQTFVDIANRASHIVERFSQN